MDASARGIEEKDLKRITYIKCEGPVVVGHYSSENENKKCDIARMAEWSKAVDLSPTIPGCAGSNPAPRIFF